MTRTETQRGFSLLELIVVMMVMAILGVSAMTFFRPALDSYFDSRRRADLTDMADTALRRMSREVRIAVPNSVQIHGTDCFRFVRTLDGGRYRKAEDTTRDDSEALDLTQISPRFDVLSPLQAAAGGWLVIGNQTGSDVYAGYNRAAITGSAPVAPELGSIRLFIDGMDSIHAPFSYTDGRFTLVPGDAPVVTYVCSGAGLDAKTGTGTGALRRIAGGFVPGETTLGACPVGGDLLARHISACRFLYSPKHGATQQNGFVWMELELAEANEKVHLVHGGHIINLP
ncbi:MAG: type II secretion system GspH family protein [Azoarcus sp.]|jgi:MSHA biogenesis protein MshO|nr:type II secretion system GspH family protein [Azoarcus sp.]